MNEPFPSDPSVALVAADGTGMKALGPSRETLDSFGIIWKETLVATAGHASFDARGLRAIIVASPDAVLPGAVAAATGLPVIRVPTPDAARDGLGLLRDGATANLPAGGAAFATVAIGEAGAKNAALFVVSMLGLANERLWTEWLAFRQRQTDAVLGQPPPAEV